MLLCCKIGCLRSKDTNEFGLLDFFFLQSESLSVVPTSDVIQRFLFVLLYYYFTLFTFMQTKPVFDCVFLHLGYSDNARIKNTKQNYLQLLLHEFPNVYCYPVLATGF